MHSPDRASALVLPGTPPTVLGPQHQHVKTRKQTRLHYPLLLVLESLCLSRSRTAGLRPFGTLQSRLRLSVPIFLRPGTVCKWCGSPRRMRRLHRCRRKTCWQRSLRTRHLANVGQNRIPPRTRECWLHLALLVHA